MSDFSDKAPVERAAAGVLEAFNYVSACDHAPKVELTGDVKIVRGKLLKEGCPQYITLEELDQELETKHEISLGITSRIRQWCAELPEFKTIGGAGNIQVVLTEKLFSVSDGPLVRTLLGRASVAKALDMELNPDIPPFRLILSLPYWIAATEAQKSAALHDLIVRFGRKGGERNEDGAIVELGIPILRKPTVTMFAATIGRFGLVDSFQAQVIAHAIAHSETKNKLQEYSFDETSRQGIFWPELAASPALRSYNTPKSVTGPIKPKVSTRERLTVTAG